LLSTASARLSHKEAWASCGGAAAPGRPAGHRGRPPGGFRHLPVLEGERVVGVISLRDVPVAVIADLRPELEQRHALAERIW